MKATSKVHLPRFGLVAMAAALLIGSAAGAEAAKDAPTEKVVAELIKQLGDGSFKVREAAQKKLIEIGPPALDQVATAVKSEDAEVSRRAEEILKVISKQAASRNDEAIKKNLLWQLPLANLPTGHVRISKGVVCLQDGDGWIRAVDVKTGKSIWSHRSDKGLCWTVLGDTVYAPDFNSDLRALDIRSGKRRREFGSRMVFGEPTVRAGKMYVGGFIGELWVVDTRTGKMLNTFKVSGAVDLAPILRGGKLYCLTRDGKAHALNLKTGKIAWSAKVAKRSLNALALGEGRVYVRADDRLLALDAETGKRLWAFPVATDGLAWVGGPRIVARVQLPGGWAQTRGKSGISPDAKPLAVAGGAVWLTAGSKILAVDAAKGTKLWEHSPAAKKGKGAPQLNADRVQVVVGGQVLVFMRVGVGGRMAAAKTHVSHSGELSPPAVAGGVMYFGSKDGLHAVDLKTRTPLWTYRTEAPVTLRPVVAGGVIYFATRSPPVMVADGKTYFVSRPTLYALKLKLPPAKGGR